MPSKKRASSLAMRKPRDATGNQADIIRAATIEFSRSGFDGTRIDAIARQTRTTRAMIYYYFGTKEKLYRAVVEGAYREIREKERQLDLTHMAPEVAMRRLAEFTFDFYQAHPEFVALVTAENQMGGRHIRRMKEIQRDNFSVIDTIDSVLAQGRRSGIFRDGFSSVELHMTIASLGWFQVANRSTFGYLFDVDFRSPGVIARHRQLVTDVVMRFVSRPGSAATAITPA
jgi:AcrR family transcriptional regulator